MSDIQDKDEFYKGMANAHEVVYNNIERLQRSISDVMGIYADMKPVMDYDENTQLRELEVAWRTLALFRDLFVDDYDEAMDEVKIKEWREASDDLKID